MLESLPLSVVVVVAAFGEERTCSTATVTYVSLDPPVIATPLRGRTGRLARAGGEFSVSVLAAGQAELAARAGRASVGDKLDEQQIPTLEPPPGFASPGIAGSVAVYWCRLERAVDALLLGRVEQTVAGDGEPLVRFRHRYRALGDDVPVVEAAYPL